MQLNLDDIALFTRISELGSLSAAARERNVPVSQVTRSLARLEAAAKVRLLHRSTHGLSLTDEGDAFLAYGRQMLTLSDEMAADLTCKLAGPAGWVRVAVSPLLAQMVIAPSLGDLYLQHPDLRIDIAADDRMADMARDGIDIAIRTGTPHGDTLVARQIGQYSRSLYAAPSYLARCGTPQHPDDLAQHHLIASSVNPNHNRWPLKLEAGNKAGKAMEIAGHTRTDNSAVMFQLVQQGVGIGQLMDLLAAPLAASGALVSVLPNCFDNPAIPIYAVMLQERQRLPKIRACIDFWVSWLTRKQTRTISHAPTHYPSEFNAGT